MTGYQVKLRDRKEVAHETLAFRFEKPPGFHFRPGQFATLTLIKPPETDEEGDVRDFSIASAPSEDHLLFTTRLRNSAFKRVLKTLPLETEVQLEGPTGSLVVHQDPARPAVFLAGGIGITPFRSMVVEGAASSWRHSMLLFYSNHRPEDAPFLQELKALEKGNSHYRFVGTMTKMKESSQSWSGETGLIDRKMLEKFIDDLTTPVYYIAGPPGMVQGLTEMLAAAGVSAANIRAEEFTGY